MQRSNSLPAWPPPSKPAGFSLATGEDLGLLPFDPDGAAFGIEQLRQLVASTSDAALHRADGTAADVRGLLVGESAGADEQERLAPFGRQLEQRDLHVRKV